jgi:hypothetical protein
MSNVCQLVAGKAPAGCVAALNSMYKHDLPELVVTFNVCNRVQQHAQRSCFYPEK